MTVIKNKIIVLLWVLLLSMTTVSVSNAALSASTVNTIEGSKPYLLLSDGVTKVTNTDELLGIKLSDGTIYSKLTNTSTALLPIELPVANQRFSDVKTLIPATLTSVNLSTLIGAPYNRWGDDDGDGGITATGNLSLTLKDVNNNVVSLTDTLEGCKSPYTLTLSTTSGTLSTQYGSPNSSNFTASSTTYYINPKIGAPYVCFAKPNLTYNYGTQPEWDGGNGFKVQDVGTPSSNFPRTGANGLFFDMTVAGTTAANVIAVNGATVSATTGANNIQLKLTVQDDNVVRVMLSGPSSGQSAGEPGPASVTMPTEFTLYSDVAKTNVLYSFALSKWFIPKSSNGGGYPATQTYCSGLPGSYRVPSVSEYTNANGDGWTDGLSGWGGNTYARAIGNGHNKSSPSVVDDGKGGLFAEWGYTYNGYYTTSEWENWYYWAIESYSSFNHYIARSLNSSVLYGDPSNPVYRAACVSP